MATLLLNLIESCPINTTLVSPWLSGGTTMPSTAKAPGTARVQGPMPLANDNKIIVGNQSPL